MTLLVLGERWLSGDHDGRQPHSAPGRYPALQQAGNLVWYPEQCTIGVAAFEGDPRHAVTLLERKLRAQGEISSDVKILVLQSQRVGRGYQVLYTTVALDEWQQMLSWAAAQPHICRVSLAVSLALARGQAAACTVVLQADRHFHFLALHDGQLIHLQAVAVDGSRADLEAVAAMLGMQVREEMAARGRERFDVLWLPVAYEGERADLDAVAAAFTAAAPGLSVQVEGEPLGARDAAGVQILSGLLGTARLARPQDLLNQGWDRLQVLAREYLPHGAVAAALAALGLAYIGYGWMADASALEQQAARLQAEEAQVRESTAAVARDIALDRGPVDKQVEMLALLRKVQGGQDPVHLLRALRRAAQGGVRILSVATAPEAAAAAGGEAAVLVDGTLPEKASDAGRDTRLLSSLVRTLAEHGYRAEPMDIRSAAADQSASTRLFSYRLTRIAEAREPGGARP